MENSSRVLTEEGGVEVWVTELFGTVGTSETGVPDLLVIREGSVTGVVGIKRYVASQYTMA